MEKEEGQEVEIAPGNAPPPNRKRKEQKGSYFCSDAQFVERERERICVPFIVYLIARGWPDPIKTE